MRFLICSCQQSLFLFLNFHLYFLPLNLNRFLHILEIDCRPNLKLSLSFLFCFVLHVNVCGICVWGLWSLWTCVCHTCGGQRSTSDACCDHCSPYVLRQGSHLVLQLSNSASLANQLAPGIPCLCPPSAGITSDLPTHPVSMLELGIPNLGPHACTASAFTGWVINFESLLIFHIYRVYFN